MNTPGRHPGKSTFQNAMAQALLDAGKTVAFAKPTHLEVHKRLGHLTSIKSLPYEETGEKYEHIVIDEYAKKSGD